MLKPATPDSGTSTPKNSILDSTIEEVAAAGRMPAFVDTGLNVVHVDDVADGHVLA